MIGDSPMTGIESAGAGRCPIHSVLCFQVMATVLLSPLMRPTSTPARRTYKAAGRHRHTNQTGWSPCSPEASAQRLRHQPAGLSSAAPTLSPFLITPKSASCEGRVAESTHSISQTLKLLHRFALVYRLAFSPPANRIFPCPPLSWLRPRAVRRQYDNRPVWCRTGSCRREDLIGE